MPEAADHIAHDQREGVARRGSWCPETPRRRPSAAATCSHREWSARRGRRSCARRARQTAVGSTTSTYIAMCGPCCSVAPSGRNTVVPAFAFAANSGQRQLGHEHAFGHLIVSSIQNIAAPPFGLTHCPVMKVRARPGKEDRRRGDLLGLRRCGRAGSAIPWQASPARSIRGPSIGVSVGPGAIALTRMCGANSRAQERVIESDAALRGAVDRAVLAAEIGKLRGDVDDAPGLLRRHARSASRPTRKAPRRFTPISRSKSAARRLEQRLFDQDAGVVDEDVEADRGLGSAALNSLSTCASSEMSAWTAKARPPSASIDAYDSIDPLLGARSAIATCAPSAANATRSPCRCRSPRP